MSSDGPYQYWPIVDRPPIGWPDGKRMACYVGINVEHFIMGRHATARTAVTAGLPYDPLNYGWRDYGARVGFWRTLGLLDELGWPASVLLNADAATRYPEVVRAGVDRGWAFLGHGRTNSELWTGLELEDERAALRRLTAELTEATGKAPRGWLGPAFTETPNTLGLLAENGFTYSLDWNADDQPFPLTVSGARFISVPYTIEVNDITAHIGQDLTAKQFATMVVDQFEVMYEEAAARPGSVFSVALHPFVTGHPFRHRELAPAFREIAGRDDVWYTTTDDVAQWYLDNHYDAAAAALAARAEGKDRP